MRTTIFGRTDFCSAACPRRGRLRATAFGLALAIVATTTAAQGEPASPAATRPTPEAASGSLTTEPAPFGARDVGEAARAAMARAADYSAEHAGRAVLVLHRGEVVFERTEGRWKPGYPHPLASGTKSFSGVLAAFAVQDGLFASFDEPVAAAIPAWRDDPRKSRITVRHLLSLSSGLDPGQDVFEKGVAALAAGRPTDAALERFLSEPGEGDFFATALALPVTEEPGARFRYGPSHFYAFGAMLEARLRERAAREPGFPSEVLGYLEARIFRPLGISVGRLGKDATGRPNLPGGASLAPREWAKFGEFVRRGGVILTASGGERRLLHAELLAECFRRSAANDQYGLTWWLPLPGASPEADVADGLRGAALRRRAPAPAAASRPAVPAASRPGGDPAPVARDARTTPGAADSAPASLPAPEILMAAGLGKQRLYVVPSRGLVIVRFARIGPDGRRFVDDEFLRPILESFAP